VPLNRHICALISSANGVLSRFRDKRAGIRILLYHSVGGELPHDAYGMSISIESFKNQIRILSEDDKCEIIALTSSTYPALSDLGDERKRIAITFDDGYKDILYNAAPVLIERGFSFTVFVTPKLLEYASGIYLNTNDLRQLSKLPGVTIGSHGMSHQKLTFLNMDDLCAELRDSALRIEDIIGKKVDLISYPHGKTDRRVMDAVQEAGYRLGAGSRFGINVERTDPMFLRRTEIWNSDAEDTFSRKLSGAWDWYGYYQRLRGL